MLMPKRRARPVEDVGLSNQRDPLQPSRDGAWTLPPMALRSVGVRLRCQYKVAVGTFIVFQLTRDRCAVHTDHLGKLADPWPALCNADISYL